MRKQPRIAVIGGGFGGIAAAVYLQRAGLRNFEVLEQSLELGGTWWDNKFPGAEVDTPSHLYSYSFKPYDWTRPFAKQPELHGYLHETAAERDLLRHFRFGAKVERIEWDDRSSRYTLSTADGEQREFDFVITAIGLLNVPKLPEWAGGNTFTGELFHTARWRDDVELTGKRVAVVGTGSTAAQVVPAIADRVAQLYVFQREPGWVDPKETPVYTPEQRKRLRTRWGRRLERTRLFAVQERRWFAGRILKPGRPVDAAATQACRDYLAQLFANHPTLRTQLTPHHPYLGKRPVHSSTFYPALLRDNVELVPQAVEALTETGIVDASRSERQVDVVVCATGFMPAEFMSQLDIIGRHGRKLQDIWAGDPKAFLGCTVPDVPNLFMMYGPNTNNYAIVFNLEQQAKFAVRAIKRAIKHGASSSEVRPSFYEAFNRWLAWRLRGTSFTKGNNYFTSKSGRVVTQWPDGILVYWLLTRTMGAISTRLRR